MLKPEWARKAAMRQQTVKSDVQPEDAKKIRPDGKQNHARPTEEVRE